MPKEITIDIDADGGITIETKGYSGVECKNATAAIEKALGKKVSDQTTAEYHKPGRNVQRA